MDAIIKFLRESKANERRWKRLINVIFSVRMSVREKKVFLYRFKYLILILLCIPIVYAEPYDYAYLHVTDQRGKTVDTNILEIEALSGIVEIINSTHYMIKMNGSALVRVLLYNITVWQGTVEAGKCYTVKAGIIEMTIESPDPSLVIYVTLIGGNRTWKLYGRGKYKIYPVPVATYRIAIHGSTKIERTLYFTGGVIRLSSNSISPQLYYIVLLSVTPIGAYSSYRVIKSRRRFSRRKRKPTKKHHLKQEKKHEKTMMESVELKPRRKHVEKTKKSL